MDAAYIGFINALYNNLPTAEQVAKDKNAVGLSLEKLQSFLESTSSPNVTSVVILHRHFDANPGTVPVWSFESGKVVLEARSPAQNLTPLTWTIDREGSVTPYEFADVSTFPNASATIDAYSGSLSKSIGDLKTIREAGLNGQLGVTWLPQLVEHAMEQEGVVLLEDDLSNGSGVQLALSKELPSSATPSVWEVSSTLAKSRVGWIPCWVRP